MNSANLVLFEFLESTLKIEIPVYIKNVLYFSGFDNLLSLMTLNENDISEIESFVRFDIVNFLEENNRSPEVFHIFADNIEKFRIMLGHKKLLFKISDYIKEKGLKSLSSKINQNTEKKLNVAFDLLYEEYGLDVPLYMANILSINGFDNLLSLQELEESDIKSMEHFAREEMIDLVKDDERVDFYGIFHDSIDKFKFIAGHRKMLLGLKSVLNTEEPPRKRKRLEDSNDNKKPDMNDIRKMLINVVNKNEALKLCEKQISESFIELHGESESCKARISCVFTGCKQKTEIPFKDNRWITSNFTRHVKKCSQKSMSIAIENGQQKQMDKFLQPASTSSSKSKNL